MTDLVARLAQEAYDSAWDPDFIEAYTIDKPIPQHNVLGKFVRDFARLVAEECAKECEAQEARILSKQDTKAKPGSDSDAVNVQLRMVAVMLPEVASAIRDRFQYKPDCGMAGPSDDRT